MNQFSAENPTIPATPRDESRRAWLQHAALVAGSAVLVSTAGSAMAQNDTSTSNSGTMENSGAMENDYPSIVDDKGTNPNHPEIVIPRAAKTAKPSDVDILNFALGLERLEADFYARVVQAHLNKAYLSPRVFEVAQKLAADEASHVQAILDILNRAGATAVPPSQFQYPSNVFFAQLAFLDLAATFEATGTGAYLGAAPKVKSSDALKFAASVYGVEARHTAIIRMLNGQSFAPSALETPLTVAEVTQRVAPFIVA